MEGGKRDKTRKKELDRKQKIRGKYINLRARN
jgi:hypothetical protein